MQFKDKLNSIARNRSELDRRAGLPVNTTSNYINRGSLPNVEIASKIARALGVSLDWLADDAQGLPPVPAGSVLTFAQLMTPEDRRLWDRAVEIHGRDVALAAAASAFVRLPVDDAAVAVARVQVTRSRQEEMPRLAAKKAPPGGKSPGVRAK